MGWRAPSTSTWSSSGIVAARRHAARRPSSVRARSTRSPGSSKPTTLGIVGHGLRALAGAAAQSGEGLGRQGASIAPASSSRSSAAAPARAKARCRSSSRISTYPEEPAGALVDAPRAPARRLRLSRRPRRDPDRVRPAHDRGAHRAHRGASSKASSARASCTALSRKRVPYPIVALVGYTNAGKSTLFNRMTSARACCPPTCCSRRSIRRCARSPCRKAATHHPVRHGRLHLRPADHSGGGVSRHAGGGDRGRLVSSARPRRFARGHATRRPRTCGRSWASSGIDAGALDGRGRSRSGTRPICSTKPSALATLEVSGASAGRCCGPVLVRPIGGMTDRRDPRHRSRIALTRPIYTLSLVPGDGKSLGLAPRQWRDPVSGGWQRTGA